MSETIVEHLIDDADYLITTESPYGSISPGRITRRASGVDGVHRILAEVIRDGVESGRYSMHIGATGELKAAMEIVTAKIEAVVAELEVETARFHQLRADNALTQPLAAQQVKVLQLQAQARQHAETAATLAEAHQVGQILLMIATQVSAGTFNPSAPLLESEADENLTFGTFAEGFIVSMSHPEIERRDWHLDVTIRRAA